MIIATASIVTFILKAMAESKLYDLVKKLLTENTTYRNSDKELIWRVWQIEGRVAFGVLRLEDYLKATPPESITRARRKVQETHPSLQAVGSVKKERHEKEKTKGRFVFVDDVAILVES